MPSHRGEEEDKPCRACSDFKSWTKARLKDTTKGNDKKVPEQQLPPKEQSKECPLDKDELGRSTWGFLHTLAAYYPENPTKAQSTEMYKFFQIFADFYPCEPCRLDFKEDIKKNPPKTESQADLMKWLCERHNTVNVKLEKPIFDCSKVYERWKDGWKDGSCD